MVCRAARVVAMRAGGSADGGMHRCVWSRLHWNKAVREKINVVVRTRIT